MGGLAVVISGVRWLVAASVLVVLSTVVVEVVGANPHLGDETRSLVVCGTGTGVPRSAA
jgi:hypothetical protein